MGLYRDLLQSYSARKIITTLAGLSKHSEEIKVSHFLHQMTHILNMTNKEIESVTVGKNDKFHGKDGLLNQSGT